MSSRTGQAVDRFSKMALPYKPHALTLLAPQSGKTASGEREVQAWPSSGYAFRGQVTPERASVAFNRYGVEIQSPWLLLADHPANGEAVEAKIRQGVRVLWGSRSFVIRAAMPFDVGLAADHVSAILEEITTLEDEDE